MIRLITFNFILILTVCILIFVSHQIGGMQPTPIIASVFINPDGSSCKMPCMFGIRTQKTGLADMLTIIGNHPYLRSWTRTSGVTPSGKWYQFAGNNQLLTIELDTNDVVQFISWGNNTCNPIWLPTIGEIISVLGYPTSVSIESVRAIQVAYIYTGFHIEIVSNRVNQAALCKNAPASLRVDPHDPVVTILVDGPTYKATAEKAKLWRGFQNAQVYLNP